MAPMSRDTRSLLRFYVSAIAVGAGLALVVAASLRGWDTSERFANGFIAILAVGLIAEVSSFTLHGGSSVVSIAFIPFLAATFLFSPFWAMVVGGTAVLLVETLVRRKPMIKAVFNSSKEILTIGLAASSYGILGGEPSVYHFNLVPVAIIGAGVVYASTNSMVLSYAVSLSEGVDFWETWQKIYGSSLLYDLFAMPIPAFLAYLYVHDSLAGVVIVSVPLFIVRHIYAQNLRLEQSNREMLELMVKQVELVEPYTSGHSKRVSQYARILAKEAGIHGKHLDQITTAALLHDVGKVYEEYAPLLRKEGKLTSDERLLLESHPVRSAELVTTISGLRGPVELAVRHHHENYDGSGYPARLTGESIPVGARIIMIADTIDAMTTDRPYRRALPFDRVLDELRKHSGRQFDPRLVEMAIRSPALQALIPGSPRSKAEPSLKPMRELQQRRAEKATA
jgi:HD-GYP domain-containing protein (c-di-GMP phosphodiesterase class II)